MDTKNDQIIFTSKKKDLYIVVFKIITILFVLLSQLILYKFSNSPSELKSVFTILGSLFAVHIIVSLILILKSSCSEEIRINNIGVFFKEQIYWDQVEKIGSIAILNYFAITLTTKNGHKILNFDIGNADIISDALINFFPERFEKRKVIAKQFRLYKKRLRYL